LKGLQTAFVFFVLHLQTRRTLLARATFSPNRRWLRQQARHGLWECEEQGVEARLFLRDNDRCYADDFDEMLRHAGVNPIHTPHAAPNANAFADHWIRSLRQECLDHLIICGLGRLQYVIDEYRRFYNEHRPHQGISNRIPDRGTQPPKGLLLPARRSHLRCSGMQCQHFLGGLLKSYFRSAA
jgi:putative transposase